ncbi:hypothetical protein INT45_007717 [Circinella minor]|uniref:Uncharacterized protein n=1 Tax=Circinella minor TaxID=1195481 RepID=A0A8H7RY43_9FUNG|nr:hypothetical protein INT45_007717 [Circinella minor]
MNRELGTGEAGRCDDLDGTKRLEKAGMKLLKTMKGMFMSLHLNLFIMDSPAGFLTRVSQLPRFLSYPTWSESLIRDLISLIYLVWATKQMMKEEMIKINTKKAAQYQACGSSKRQKLSSTADPPSSS